VLRVSGTQYREFHPAWQGNMNVTVLNGTIGIARLIVILQNVA
jgi:hypothetical protein